MAAVRAIMLALLLVASSRGRPGWAAPGDLDPSFGTGGWATTPLADPGSIFALALQPDGKIVAAGQAPLGTRIIIARYLPDGTLDPGFGSAGVVQTLPAGRANGGAFGVALQPDGRIVVAGQVNDPVSGAVLAVIRLLPGGGLDTSFGTAGSVVASDRSGGRAVVVQGDGRIVVALAQAALVRYLSDGTPDISFGSAGIATAPLGTTSGAAALLMQADGKLVAAWSATSGTSIARWVATGALDGSFGSGGIVSTSLFPFFGPALALQPDGKLLLGVGDVTLLSVLQRWDAAGNPDFTFGGTGTVGFGAGRFALLTAIAVQPGRILAAGIEVTPPLTSPTTNFLVEGIRPDGQPAADLGSRIYDLGAEDTARAALLQPDGRLVVGGASDDSSASFAAGAFALARIDASGCGDAVVVPGAACGRGNCGAGDRA